MSETPRIIRRRTGNFLEDFRPGQIFPSSVPIDLKNHRAVDAVGERIQLGGHL